MNRQLVYKCRKRQSKLNFILRLIGILIVFNNLILYRYLKSILGFILIILTFYKKEIYLCGENIEFVHRGLFFRYVDILPISDIKDIVIKHKEEKTIICLISDYNFKKILVDINYANIIIEDLMRKNKNMSKINLV